MIKISHIYIFALVVVGLTIGTSVRAAELYYQPTAQTAAVGDTFIAEVLLDGEDEVINAIQAELIYPTELLEVVEVNRGGSFVSLWVEEPTVDEVNGRITLVGGIPQGTYAFGARVITITFKVLAAGTANLRFNSDSTSAHLNDGLGTAANLTYRSGTAELGPVNSFSLAIQIPNQPDVNTWYNNNDIVVRWESRENSLYVFDLVRTPNVDIAERSADRVSQASFTDIADGVHYFILKEKLDFDDWQIVAQRRIMIDTMAPLLFTPILAQEDSIANGQYILSFNTTDATSGVSRYEVQEGKNFTTKATSPYILLDQSPSSPLTVRAYDAAGNVREVVIAAEDNTGRTPLMNFFLLGVMIALVIAVIAIAVAKKYR